MTATLYTSRLIPSRLGTLGASKRYVAPAQYQQYQPPVSSVDYSDPNASGDEAANGQFQNSLTNLGSMYLYDQMMGSEAATAGTAGTTGAVGTSEAVGTSGVGSYSLAESGVPMTLDYGAAMSGTGTTGVSGATGTGTGTSALASGLQYAGPIAAGLMLAYAIHKSEQGNKHDVISSPSEWWTAGTHGQGVQQIRNLFGSGLNPREVSRNAWRRSLEEKLGVERFGDRDDLDPKKNPLDAEAIALADPLAEVLANGDTKNREDAGDVIARQLTMGARHSFDMKENLLSILNKLEVTPQQVRQGLNQSYRNGNIDRSRAMAYANNMAQMTGRSPEQEFNYIVGARNG